MGVKTHTKKGNNTPGREKDLLAEGQREEIKSNVLTELTKIHCETHDHIPRLLCVGCDRKYQLSICADVYVCL